MNAADRAALQAIAEQLAELAKQVGKLDYLAEPETIEVLKGLVEAAPTLGALAKGYDAAGLVGSWFGKIVKWTGIAAGAVIAVATLVSLWFGDSK